MEKTRSDKITVHREVYQLEDFVSPRSGVKEFSTWLREYEEGSAVVKWIPINKHGEMLRELGREVKRDSMEFKLEARLAFIDRAREMDEEVFGEEEVETTASACQYIVPWAGECGKETVAGSDYCEKHDGETCFACDKQATRGCSHAGSLVCGVPECDDHNHNH